MNRQAAFARLEPPQRFLHGALDLLGRHIAQQYKAAPAAAPGKRITPAIQDMNRGMLQAVVAADAQNRRMPKQRRGLLRQRFHQRHDSLVFR